MLKYNINTDVINY